MDIKNTWNWLVGLLFGNNSDIKEMDRSKKEGTDYKVEPDKFVKVKDDFPTDVRPSDIKPEVKENKKTIAAKKTYVRKKAKEVIAKKKENIKPFATGRYSEKEEKIFKEAIAGSEAKEVNVEKLAKKLNREQKAVQQRVRKAFKK